MRIIRPSGTEIGALMARAVGRARCHGIEHPSFPFPAEAVDGIHTDRCGVGDGIWFRLKDGRVFDDLGREQDPNPRLYDTLRH